MNRTSVYSGLVLGVWLAFAAGSGCAGDDAKIAVQDGGAGGEGGDLSVSGATALGGSASGSANANAGSGAGGSSDGDGDGGSAVGGSAAGGSDASSSAGETSAGAGASGGGGSGTNEAGAGSTDEGEPVPSACTSCGSDFCVAARVACQSDPACVACRDENYHTLACAQNTNFTSWINCICAAGCTAPCAAFCAG